VKTGRMAPSGEPNDRGILQVIKSCIFGIVVYNEFRHNISYEWGLMDAFGMPVIPFKDHDKHIDIDKDFSDKKGVTFVHYSGDSDEKDIIEELENSDSLKAALENVQKRIGKSISSEETDEVKEASRMLTGSNIPLGAISINEERLEIPDVEQTLNVFSRVSKLTAEGHLYQANALYYEDSVNAEREYREAIRLNPDYADAHNNLGALLRDLKRFEEAEEELKKAIRLNSNFAEAHGNLGMLYSVIGRLEDAEKELEIAKRLFEEQGRAEDVKRAEDLLKSL
jgi:tetratricopeptide (TPR) repeat protein